MMDELQKQIRSEGKGSYGTPGYKGPEGGGGIGEGGL